MWEPTFEGLFLALYEYCNSKSQSLYCSLILDGVHINIHKKFNSFSVYAGGASVGVNSGPGKSRALSVNDADPRPNELDKPILLAVTLARGVSFIEEARGVAWVGL